MDENELHELDAWIAEHLYGKSIADIEDYDIAETFKPSSDPTDFADVKREITKKGWDWEVNARWQRDLPGIPALVYYQFKIFDSGNKVSDNYTHHNLIGHGTAQTEELAGCRAVQFALGGGQIVIVSE